MFLFSRLKFVNFLFSAGIHTYKTNFANHLTKSERLINQLDSHTDLIPSSPIVLSLRKRLETKSTILGQAIRWNNGTMDTT